MHMSEEDFRRMIKDFVERKELAPETAEYILKIILKMLFPDGKKQDDG